MTVNEVKELLKNLKLAKNRAEQCKRIWLRSKENVELLAAIDYTAERVDGGEKQSIQERFCEKENEAKEKYIQACEAQFEIEDRISDLMIYLTPAEQVLVTDRFMDDVPVYKIYEQYGYALETLKNKFWQIYKKMAAVPVKVVTKSDRKGLYCDQVVTSNDFDSDIMIE